MKTVLVPNIVEGNGQTIRENNMELKHNIPVGKIVEITCDNEDKGKFFKIRRHIRDCDGSPIYDLVPFKQFFYGEESFKVSSDEIQNINNRNEQ